MAKKKKSSSSNASISKDISKAYKKSKNKPLFIVCLVILILIIGTGTALYYTGALDGLLNRKKTSLSGSSSEVTSSVISSSSDGGSASTDGIIEGSKLTGLQIHVMELGNASCGDSIYIKAGDTDILIDAGSETSSAATIESYVDNYCTDGKLEYVIVTHGDADHIYGMYGTSSNGILYHYKVGTLIDTGLTNKTSKAYKTYYVGARNYAISQGTNYYTAAQCWNGSDGASRQYVLSSSPAVTMDILYNKFYFETSTDENNYSVCTMLTCGTHHFMLTGDLELEGETALAAYYDGSSADKTLPEMDFFKAGHHGSKTSSNDVLLSIIKPKVCFVSCCAGGSEYTNIADNTFPTQQFINRIAPYTSRVYVTTMIDNAASTVAGSMVNKSMNGTLTISTDGTSLAIHGSSNLTKLKDTDWFNQTIYVDSDGKYCSGAGKVDYYTSSTSSPVVTSRAQRTWPANGVA